MEGNSLNSFENLCKIFETRIKLDKEKNIETPPDVLINYEKYSKKIDSIYNSKFEKEIKPLIVPAVTIEKEEERLGKLISLLKSRLEKREELENRFYLTTGRYIKGLQLVVSESEFEDKKNRLETITKYLDTRNEINTVNESISELKDKLSDEVAKQDEYIKKNKIMEDELYNTFKDVISNDDYLSKLNEDDIDTEIAMVIDKVKDNKETLDVTKDSVNSLMISGDNDDYASYIEDAERSYFTWKNRELLLKIYSLVIKFEDNYNDLYEKRDKINRIVRNRRSIKDNLTIEVTDNFSSFEDVLKEQLDVLKNEKEVLENVSNYTNRISFKEERLSELEEANNSVEILSILREYGLIDTYDNKEELEEVPLETSELEEDNGDEEEIFVKEINPYRIVDVIDYPKSLNIGLARLKGESVREKVNKKLNPTIKAPTFDDITNEIDNSKEEDKVIDTSNNDLVDDKKLDNEGVKEDIVTPTWDIPKKEEVVTPTWEVPKKEDIIKKDDTDIKVINDDNIPVWGSNINTNINTVEEVNTSNGSVPIWNDTFKTSESNNLNNNISTPSFDLKEENNKEEMSSENMFWVPVSDSKLDANVFPSIDIPVNNGFNGTKDNFGFPDINN
ncbi:MAG: hypothetical protein SPF04_01715 [Bacilli bacterium]|nr:hypothetical protein [Bacilli bacterium]